MAQTQVFLVLLAALVIGCSAQIDVSGLRSRSARLAAVSSVAAAPAVAEEEDFAAVAKAAAKKAWKLAKKVAKSTKETGKLAKEIEEAESEVKTAMEVAKKGDEQMEEIYNETKESTVEAAKAAALEYFEKVKEAGASAVALAAAGNSPEATKATELDAQAKIAKAAVEAAMPYNAALVKGQKRAIDYQRRAQAMSAAGSRLQLEGARLAPQAQGYQTVGSALEASQIMMTAHALVDEGAKMKRQAESLHKTATELTANLPAYATAEKAAMLHASAVAGPAFVAPDAPEPY